MDPLEYHRPKSIDEALTLIQRGQPLAGGTELVPRRLRLTSVVDLQDLGLDEIQETPDGLSIGATVRLQRLVEAGGHIPAALAEACRQEAALNLRNMATLAGTVVAADGRSPVAAVLLALDAQARLQPGDETISIDSLLDRRAEWLKGRLIVALTLPTADYAAYEQVARAPMDRPLVCASVARLRGRPEFRVTLGGFGLRPLALIAERPDPRAAAEAAALAYAEAGDAWASAEYRSAVAGILVRRLMENGVGR